MKKYSKFLSQECQSNIFDQIANRQYRNRVLPTDIILLISRAYKIDKGHMDSDFATFEARNGTCSIKDALSIKDEDVVIHRETVLDLEKSFSNYHFNHGEPIVVIFS